MDEKVDLREPSNEGAIMKKLKHFASVFGVTLFLAFSSCASGETPQDSTGETTQNPTGTNGKKTELVDNSKDTIQGLVDVVEETESIDMNNDTIESHYDDGSWSKEIINDIEQKYFLYYPNDTIKCYCHKGEGGQEIKVYNEGGKMMYGDEFPESYETDSPNDFEQFDKKGRLIRYGNYEISYDDKRGTKTTIKKSFGGRVIRIKVESSESGYVVSDEIRGEAGNIINAKDLCDFLNKMGIPAEYLSYILFENIQE